MGDDGSELAPDLFGGGRGILDRVMQQAGGDAHRVHVHFSQHRGNGERVGDEGAAGAAALVGMQPGGEVEGALQQVGIVSAAKSASTLAGSGSAGGITGIRLARAIRDAENGTVLIIAPSTIEPMSHNSGPTEHPGHPHLAYQNEQFLNTPDARTLRILAEYLEPQSRLRRENIQDTIVFFGSARIHSRESAGSEEAALAMARYYDDARELSRRLTEWAMALPRKRRRFIVTSGGGPGIMEAANRGAHEAGGRAMGLNIRLPFEQNPNEYISPELNFEFHYFFMRKFWFAYLAKALVAFPGGFGTLDELMEILTLAQTQKLAKKIIVIVYGKEYWSRVLNLEALADAGAISPDDTQLFSFCDSPEEAFECLKEGLTKYHLQPQPARPVPEEGPEIAKTLP